MSEVRRLGYVDRNGGFQEVEPGLFDLLIQDCRGGDGVMPHLVIVVAVLGVLGRELGGYVVGFEVDDDQAGGGLYYHVDDALDDDSFAG